MDNSCANCGSDFGVLSNIFASKLFPAKCSKCGSKSYRKHNASYHFATVFLSLGFIVLLFLAMSQGFGLALTVLIAGLFLQVAIYAGEVVLISMEAFTPSIEKGNALAGKKKSLIALAFIILSALLYVTTEGI